MQELDEFVDAQKWIVKEVEQGTRLDHFLSNRKPEFTRSRIKRLIDAGFSTVDGTPISRPAQKVRKGQEVGLYVPPPEPLSVMPENIPLDIRYEDEAVLVVNKPQGLVVHPAPGHPNGTLVNAVLFGRTARGGDPLRPGIVHRLDKDTSGLIVVAKSEEAHASLARQFHDHSVDRCYQTLVAGNPPAKGEWQTLHGRHPRDRRRFSSKIEKGKPALSRFVREERFKGAALLKVTLFTGRTHQVRVHCHDHGYPVLGDPWYGPRHLSKELINVHKSLEAQALHACLLCFNHPETEERLLFESTPPETFRTALKTLQLLKT